MERKKDLRHRNFGEMTDIVYDTLMNNRQNRQLDLNKVSKCDVNRNTGGIEFKYGRFIYRIFIS